tara:strand:+ start:30 stop:299 length:270 start_codon:yes stop_codon:yes gene_type:complete
MAKATEQAIVAPPPTTVTDEFGKAAKRGLQGTGMVFEISFRSLWILNEEIIGKQEEVVLTNGSKTAVLLDNYKGPREEGQRKLDAVRAM